MRKSVEEGRSDRGDTRTGARFLLHGTPDGSAGAPRAWQRVPGVFLASVCPLMSAVCVRDAAAGS